MNNLEKIIHLYVLVKMAILTMEWIIVVNAQFNVQPAYNLQLIVYNVKDNLEEMIHLYVLVSRDTSTLESITAVFVLLNV